MTAAMVAISIHTERLLGLIAALALMAASPLPAAADGIGNENAPPQETCGLCHGLDGVSRMSKFPRLAGQKAAYIEKQLHDFRDGRRVNDGGQMNAIVTEFGDDKLREAADYFASLAPPPPIPADAAGSDQHIARRLFREGDASRGIPPCAECHLPGAARAPSVEAPYLSAQHPDYIVKQLQDFSAGERENDPAGGMAGIAKALSAKEIAALALFLAAMPRDLARAE
jgi:cytochrome c553